jgi:DNA-binding winged helix-turn-helix (wHTH) protein
VIKPPHAIATLRPKPMDHNRSLIISHRTSPALTDADIEFGRFRVLLRQRRLLAGDEPIELGARAFDLLTVLIEADGALVTKDELQSRVWPGIIVGQDNLKTQIAALRKALGQDREFVRTEHGRGYRFTAAVRDTLPTPECWLARIASTPQNSRESASLMDLSVIASRLARLEVRLDEVLTLKGMHRANGRRHRTRHYASHSSPGTRQHRPINSGSHGTAVSEKLLDLTC